MLRKILHHCDHEHICNAPAMAENRGSLSRLSVMATFPDELGQPVPLQSSSTVQRRSSRISGTGAFTGHMSFLSPNHECQITEGNLTNGLTSSFLHPSPDC